MSRIGVNLIVWGVAVFSWASNPPVNTDWPQWRGPNRDSVSLETGLALDWNARPPREMWSAEVGNGLSCVVVANDRAFTMGWTSNHGGEDTIWCFNAETGAVLWKQTYPNYQFLSGDHALPDPKSLRGPNSTPCVDGDRIYTSTSSGKVLCLRTDTGEVLWERNLRAETGADRNDRCAGHDESDINTASPIVIGDVVVFGIGFTGVAVDKLTGKIRWGWSGGGETVASPVHIPLNGVDYVGVVDSDRHFHLTDIKSGKEKELKNIDYSAARYAPDPLFSAGNLILNGNCYSTSNWQKLWSSKGGAYAPNLVSNGFLYQCNQYEGQLSCLDLKDGSSKASGKITKYSSYIMAQGKLLALGGEEIDVVQAAPDGIKVEGILKLPGKGQGYLVLPTLSDGRLFVRGQIGKVTVYDIRGPGYSAQKSNRFVSAPTPTPVVLTPPIAPLSKPTDQDWPQTRGPLRNGVAPSNNLHLDWTRSQPRQLWQTNIGPAFSGMTLVGDRIYTVGFNYRSGFYYGGGGTAWSTICCLDARNGQQIWTQNCSLPRHPDFVTPDLSTKVYGNFPFWNYDLFYFGSHATPTIEGDRLYMLDQAGGVECLSTEDGKIIWQKNLTKDLELDYPNFYFSGSPLVMGKALVLSMGTSGVALDKENGKVLWSTGKDAGGAASPILFTQGGKPTLAVFGKDKLVTLSADTGTPIWNYNWVDGYGRNLCDPIPAGDDQLLVFGGGGKGSALLRAGSGKPVWEQKALDPLMGTPILYQGYIYGPSQSQKGVVCLNGKTGAVQWTSEPMLATQVILSGDILVIQCQNGDLNLAKASPQGYVSLGKYHALQSANCFVPPIISHGKLICRSWEGDIVALDLTTLDPIRVPVIPGLTKDSFKELLTQLGAPKLMQRQAAIDVLSKATDQEVPLILPGILETVKGNSWLAQDAAAQLLQQLGARAKPVGSYLVPLIQANIKSHDWAMVTILLETLKKVDPASLGLLSPAIQEAMGDSDKLVRIAAIQFLDRVPFTDGIMDALLTQAKDENNYLYIGSAIRRLGRVDPTAGGKLLPKVLPSIEQPEKQGHLDWRTALFILRDLGGGARNAIPALVKFSMIDTWKDWDVRWAKEFSEETLRGIRLIENSNIDPLERYAYINTPPITKDMQVTCLAGKSVTAKMECSDRDDFERNLHITAVTNPAHGKVKINGLNMEYQADNGYVGKDVFTWKASDPTSDSGIATTTIQVQ